MAKTLSIYACSGIGSNANVPESGYNYWLDNTETVSNTQAVNSLLVTINLLATEVLYLDLSDDDVLENLNAIDLYSTILYFVKQYQDNADQLSIAGDAIGKAYDNGLFIFADFDNQKRDYHLDEVISKIEEYMDDAELGDPSSEWQKWWDENVSALNDVFLTPEQQNAVRESLRQSSKEISGIGTADWTANPELAKYMNDAGEYFLYTYATEEQLNKLPGVFRSKARVQKQVYDYCGKLFIGVYGTQEAYDNLLRASVIKTMGQEPEQVIETLVAGSTKPVSCGIGLIEEVIAGIIEIISIIMSILSLIATIIYSICSAVAAAKVTEQKKIEQETIKLNQATEEDINQLAEYAAYKKKYEEQQKRMPLLIAGVAALILMLKK